MRKTSDTVLVGLLDQQVKDEERAEKCYRRLKRAFNALEKVRKGLTRLSTRIRKRREELDK